MKSSQGNIRWKFLTCILSPGKWLISTRFNKPAIYIGGCGRSGTTLLLSVLGAHHEIFAVPKELDLFQDAFLEKGKVITPYFYRLFRTMLFARKKKTACRYCEKSPSNVRNIELIDKKHEGNFKFIHITRDGRDVILSRHPRKKNDFWVEPERWINDVTEGLKYIGHPNVMHVRYEDLVLNFEAAIRDICAFLQIEVTPEILNWHAHTTVRRNNALHQPIENLFSTSIGKYKRPEYHDRVDTLMKQPGAVNLLKQLKYL